MYAAAKVKRKLIREPCDCERNRARAAGRAARNRSRSRANAELPPELRVDRVVRNCESGAVDILFAQVRERFLEFAASLRVGARDKLRASAGLPDAQVPNPVKTHLCEVVQFGIRNVV